MIKKYFVFFGFLALFFVILPGKASAWTYNKDYIISNNDLTDKYSMDLSNIRGFLKSKGSGLLTYTTTALDGSTKSAAQIINETSKKYNLSPKFFLTMIQKESGLIERGDVPSTRADWVLGYAVCDSCSKDDPNVIKYKGFSKQLDAAGNRVRNGYLSDLATRGYTISGWGPGITKTTVDGVVVTPKNDATAVLYTYNPWVGAYGGGDPRWGGNSLFGKKWAEYFPGLYYPNGSLLQLEDLQEFYLIQNGKKYKFASLGVLYINYDPGRIISVPSSVIDLYELGGTIRFPNYSLLQAPTGTVYLYVDGVRRGITSKEVLRQLGYNPEEIIPVQWSDLSGIPEGPVITSADSSGSILLQDGATGAVFYLDSQRIIHPIWHRAILVSRFQGVAITVTTGTRIKSYTQGAPVKLKDGTLVASAGDPSVYVIADGYRRPFISGDVFNNYGYRWDKIIWVSKQVLELHPRGSYIK